MLLEKATFPLYKFHITLSLTFTGCEGQLVLEITRLPSITSVPLQFLSLPRQLSLSLVPPGPWGFQRRGSSPARRPSSPPGASSGSSPLQPSSPTGDSRRRRPSPPPFSPGGGAKGGREELRQAGAEGRSYSGLRRSAWRGGAARSGAEGWRCGDGRRGGEEQRGLTRRGGAAAAGAEGRGHGRPALRGGVAVGCARRGWRFGTDGRSSDGRRGGKVLRRPAWWGGGPAHHYKTR